ncbi:NahK/ErcS family hybrid sensor histidine kinase/response regulator [Sphingomonas sp. VNH70]|uniref:hybrid sensor histidine kinase/response regulator n=1 Tax=Sphingomonas silueang TaxID=3156617 RepID=UPI0032B5E178
MTGRADDGARIAVLEARIAKLERINAALMDRVERSTDLQGNAFSVFETAIALESKVRERTADLERALDDLAASNAALAHARDTADAARRRMGDAIEALDEGFAIFDADDRLVLCNRPYLSLWPTLADRIRPGVAFGEIAGAICEVGPTLGRLVAPARWVSERIGHHQVADGGHVIALADGRWIQVNEQRTSEGGIVGVYTDITNIKAEDARERARELAERALVLQGTLDAMPQGVCVFAPDRALVAWNDPLLTLLDLPPRHARQRIADHAALLDWCRAKLPRADAADTLGWVGTSAAGRVGTDEVVAVRRLSDGRSIEIRRRPMGDGGMVMSFDDVTERLRTADALEQRVATRTRELEQEVRERQAAELAMRAAKTAAEQANLSKTRFLAAASHDLLQPLNAARLFVSALAGRRLAAGNRKIVDQAASALDSIEGLLEALLEISKLDAGAITPEFGDIPLDEMFTALRAEFAVIATERGLTLRVVPTRLWVHSDRRLLRRILQNFLSNAVRYTRQGSITMAARQDGSAVEITVADTGPGIDAAHHSEIFEEFRRLDAGASQGIGLGLAIVQRASRMLDHPIALKSAPGDGATFSVAVPLAVTGTARLPAPATPVRGIGVSTVLVLDNEESILAGMKAMVGGWGVRVHTAASLDDARAMVRRTRLRPDVILADYHLGGDTRGDAAVAALRADIGAEVPAAIITADRMPALRERLIASGLHVLQKPVKPAQLRALLASVR